MKQNISTTARVLSVFLATIDIIGCFHAISPGSAAKRIGNIVLHSSPSSTPSFSSASPTSASSLFSPPSSHSSSSSSSSFSSSVASSSSFALSDRRQALASLTSSIAIATCAAVIIYTPLSPSNAATKNAKRLLYPAEITAKAFFDVRITGFVTGEEKATSEDFVGRMVFGLFGKAAPIVVGEFIKYTKAPYGGNYPSYAFSSLTKRTPGVSVEAGRIKGLKEIEIAGTREYEYGDQLLGAKGMDEPMLALKHDRRGLLTKSSTQDAVDPVFEMTLGPQPALDNGDSIVFGILLEGQEALDAMEKVPIYTYESAGEQPEALNSLFTNQKKLFLSMAKSLNDERAVNRQGSFLKRVEVLNVGLL